MAQRNERPSPLPPPQLIVQIFPHLETTRQALWPTDTDLGTKLLGPVDELRLTKDTLATTGLSIATTSNAEDERQRADQLPPPTPKRTKKFVLVIMNIIYYF